MIPGFKTIWRGLRAAGFPPKTAKGRIALVTLAIPPAAYVGAIAAHEKAKRVVYIENVPKMNMALPHYPAVGEHLAQQHHEDIRRLETPRAFLRGPRGGIYYMGPSGRIYVKR